MDRKPCTNCPWRRTTKRRGFPGGCVSAPSLLAMAEGRVLRAMQCHATPDDNPAVCAGFARRFPDVIGVRLARALSPERCVVDEADPPLNDLHTLASLLRAHGTSDNRPGMDRACVRDSLRGVAHGTRSSRGGGSG